VEQRDPFFCSQFFVPLNLIPNRLIQYIHKGCELGTRPFLVVSATPLIVPS
jgi:hypothetical protein